MLHTHVVMDLGWDDSLAIGLIQKHLSEIRFIEYIEVSHTTLDGLSAELRTRPYHWGRVWLPHDGFSKSLNSGGKSTEDIMRGLGWDVVPRHEITEMGLEEGIRLTRLTFPRMYFDRSKCCADKSPGRTQHVNHTPLSNRLLECLKRYRRHINRQTDTTTTPVHDINAHGADMTRYVALNSDGMTNTGAVVLQHPAASISINYLRQSGSGWMSA